MTLLDRTVVVLGPVDSHLALLLAGLGFVLVSSSSDAERSVWLPVDSLSSVSSPSKSSKSSEGGAHHG